MTGISKQLLQGHMFIDYLYTEKWYSDEMSNWCVTLGHALLFNCYLMTSVLHYFIYPPVSMTDCLAALPQSMSFV